MINLIQNNTSLYIGDVRSKFLRARMTAAFYQCIKPVISDKLVRFPECTHVFFEFSLYDNDRTGP